MARGVNKVILVGSLGRDPEMKYTASGTAICNISIATSEKWKDKETGQPVEKTEWHRVVSFKRTAEVMGEYLRKGSQVYIEGKLQTRKWQDQNGQDRYTTEVVCHDMQMLGNVSRETSQSGSGGFRKPNPPPASDRQDIHPENQSTVTGGDFKDDDIPF